MHVREESQADDVRAQFSILVAGDFIVVGQCNANTTNINGASFFPYLFISSRS